jgi:ABC-type branched-subunit amino acid transport system ATPase component
MTNALERELGEPREIFAKLTAEEAELLVRLIERRRVSNRRSLDKAIDEVMGMLPRLVRPAAKKVMFGG